MNNAINTYSPPLPLPQYVFVQNVLAFSLFTIRQLFKDFSKSRIPKQSIFFRIIRRLCKLRDERIHLINSIGSEKQLKSKIKEVFQVFSLFVFIKEKLIEDKQNNKTERNFQNKY